MLLVADRNDDRVDVTAPTMSGPRFDTAARPVIAGGRYGEGRRPNVPAMILAALIPALLIAAAVHTRMPVTHRAQPRLVVLNLSAPPPPPPPSSPSPPPAAKTPPTPRTIVASPVPVPQIDLPAAPLTAPANPAPQPAPAPVAAPPAAPAPPARPAPPGMVKAGDLGVRMISAVPPRYPTESRRKREQGTVVLGLTLDVTGRVASIRVVRSSGFDRLDDAALRAVNKWRWAPTTRDGQAVMVQGEVEIPFVLKT